MPKQTDLYAPITDEELKAVKQTKSATHDLYAPITDEEVKKVKDSIPTALIEKSSPLMTGVQEFANAESGGYLPHIAAMSEPFFDAVTKPVIAPAVKYFTGTDISQTKNAPISQMIPGSPAYIQARDENIKRMIQMAADNPKSALAGKIGGAIVGSTLANAVMPGSGGIGGAAEAAGTQAALMNPGDKPGEVGLQLGDRVRNFGYGAATGAILQGAAEAAPLVKKLGTRAWSDLNGISPQELQTYANRTAEVNQLIVNSGGNTHEAANLVRDDLMNSIAAKKAQFNNQISKQLESAPKDANIPIGNIVDTLQAAKSRLNPNFKADDIAEIDQIIAKVQSEGAQTQGLVSLDGLNDIKKFLQDSSSSTYSKGGQIFARGSDAAKAAKSAASIARTNLNLLAPEVAAGNNGLAALHDLEDSINKNLIQSGKPEAALIAAGTGGNQKSVHDLKQVEKLTGYPALGMAQNVAAARTFANPSFIPVDTTGKSVARMATAAGLGAAAGPVGLAVAGGTMSPLATKMIINGVDKAKPLFNAINQILPTDPVRASYVIDLLSRANHPDQSSKPVKVDDVSAQFFKSQPSLVNDIPDVQTREAVKEAIKKPIGAVERRMKR